MKIFLILPHIKKVKPKAISHTVILRLLYFHNVILLLSYSHTVPHKLTYTSQSVCLAASIGEFITAMLESKWFRPEIK